MKQHTLKEIEEIVGNMEYLQPEMIITTKEPFFWRFNKKWVKSVSKELFSLISASNKSYAEEQIKEIRTEWHERIDEVIDGLEEEYGKSNQYSPNYEGIIEDLFEKKLERLRLQKQK
jgi:hypothetical protein